jgi:3-methyladenine DNA glycosylase AlkD
MAKYDAKHLVKEAQKALKDAANPTDAPAMQAYLKTDMPFYGVKTPPRRVMVRDLGKAFLPATQADYDKKIKALWALPHREEKYLAIGLARRWKAFIQPEAMPLYEKMIREGGWWDLVDDIAKNLVGKLVWDHPKTFWPLMEKWIHDDDLWIRRTAVLCQLAFKERTEKERLFDFCLDRAHEKDFFMRKAIGWALRQYSYADPKAVRAFVQKHEKKLSPLSRKEALKAMDEGTVARVQANQKKRASKKKARLK